MKERIIYISIILVLLTKLHLNNDVITTTTTTTTTIDTLYITDSIIINKPQYIDKYITHHITDTLYSVDSILVPVHIPIETAIYSDSTSTYKYKAQISGYNPSLDKLDIYTTTPQYNSTTIIKQGKPKKFSLSVGVGYQPFNNHSIGPTITVGYNIFSF
ncbi:MAG: hypothetical protein LBV71_16190 [Prevotella sp.]|jgi:hypothetical protein|nr:hypothetical protein [Prevotella sp.]